MKGFRIALGMALLAAGGAQAQLVEQALAPVLEPQSPSRAPFADSFKPYPRVYGGNENATPNQKYFPDFGTDPKLVGGFELTPNFAIETGYLSLRDRGFHKLEDSPRHVPNSLGTRSFTTYVAGKFTVPLSERVSAFAKAGYAHSERKYDVGRTPTMGDTDNGPFLRAGAQIKVNKQTTVSGEVGRVGNTSEWKGSNASGVNAKLKMGF